MGAAGVEARDRPHVTPRDRPHVTPQGQPPIFNSLFQGITLTLLLSLTLTLTCRPVTGHEFSSGRSRLSQARGVMFGESGSVSGLGSGGVDPSTAVRFNLEEDYESQERLRWAEEADPNPNPNL